MKQKQSDDQNELAQVTQDYHIEHTQIHKTKI